MSRLDKIKHWLFALCVPLVLVVLLGASPPNYLRSVQPLQLINPDTGITVNVCTSFSINSRVGLWATAEHCALPKVRAGGTEVTWVMHDSDIDIAVFVAQRVPALELAVRAPGTGDEILLVGYPNASLVALTFFGRVSHPAAEVQKGLTYGIYNILGVGGDSGGPVLDVSGRVVGVASGSTMNGIVVAAPFTKVRDALKKYVE